MARPELPRHIDPMLCKIGKPFSSDDHLFEIKWDGTRAITFVEPDGHRMHNRRRSWMTERYPDLAFLSGLPEGTVLDGELVVLVEGQPDFGLIMGREHARGERRIAQLAKTTPVTYAVFDCLYRDYEPLLRLPLVERRQHLEEIVTGCDAPRLLLSEGITGDGETLYEHACARELEGITAKRLDSPYLPGKRTDNWQKIKRVQQILCVVIGYVAASEGDIRSLVIATDEDGDLRSVGRVGSGITDATRKQLWEVLSSRQRPAPLVPCAHEATWVEPGVFCVVNFLERTKNGELRAPVFKQLIVE